MDHQAYREALSSYQAKLRERKMRAAHHPMRDRWGESRSRVLFVDGLRDVYRWLEERVQTVLDGRDTPDGIVRHIRSTQRNYMLKNSSLHAENAKNAGIYYGMEWALRSFVPFMEQRLGMEASEFVGVALRR